jgi:hypothetical protein
MNMDQKMIKKYKRQINNFWKAWNSKIGFLNNTYIEARRFLWDEDGNNNY